VFGAKDRHDALQPMKLPGSQLRNGANKLPYEAKFIVCHELSDVQRLADKLRAPQATASFIGSLESAAFLLVHAGTELAYFLSKPRRAIGAIRLCEAIDRANHESSPAQEPLKGRVR
jgi:hypothetical protein